MYLDLPSASLTKLNSYKTINKLLFPRKHKKASAKKDSQTFLKKASLIEVALKALGPTESLLLVCQQTRYIYNRNIKYNRVTKVVLK